MSSMDPTEHDRHRPPKPMSSKASVTVDDEAMAFANLFCEVNVLSRVCAASRVAALCPCNRTSSRIGLRPAHLHEVSFAKTETRSRDLQVQDDSRPPGCELVEPG